ncbi:MAG TPA: DNA-3-methyladenine glycosylase [Beutenbergiaceae bacterium]|nr:DNA-3-methyladenine glycosylase [Beutenbergiaceae bacterium]
MTVSPLRSLDGTALDVAPGLLGAVLTTLIDGAIVSVRLAEVEAYEGAHDPGSHAYRGRTPRNEVMFGPPGHLYVYRHMGLHHCVNLVCGQPGTSSAVLLRAGEVIRGQDVAFARRRAAGVCRTAVDLARGPGRLAVALGLTHAHNGTALSEEASPKDQGHAATEPRVHLRLPDSPAGEVATGPRVGVNGPGGDGEVYPWRFWLPQDPHVSAFRPGKPRTGDRVGPRPTGKVERGN